ncbi:MAG: PTS IIA-like nitrogen regulatory protein PtsN [Halieaceae bacterium]|jgi:PTS system nitrogen regulatory IIA component|nr:PTS IIA-like nitrogen regulatory protein PtsN [Halieaceae bacterium]
MFQLKELLSPALTFCAAPGTSKKKVIETASALIAERRSDLEAAEIYNNLLARERLGSTALGDGIAIPHCRLTACQEPVGSLITLEEPVDFDASDGQRVDILFILMVPEEATQEHLDILAGLARLLSQAAFCDALRAAESDEALYRAAVDYEL